MYSLSITHKDGSSRMEQFSQAEVSIGRVPGNDLVLPGANISKRHARIVFNYSKNSFVVIDNKSTNGTTINGERIEEPYDLQEGDKIYIGDFVIEVQPGPKGAKPTGGDRPRAKLAPLKGEKTQQATKKDVADALSRGKGGNKGDFDDDFEEDWDDTPAPAPAPAADDWDDEADDPTPPAAAPKSPAASDDDEWNDDSAAEPAAAPAAAADGDEDWEDDDNWDAPADPPAPAGDDLDDDPDGEWDDGGAAAAPAKKKPAADDALADELDELAELESALPERRPPRSVRERPAAKRPEGSGLRDRPKRPERSAAVDDELAALEADVSEPELSGADQSAVIECLQRYIDIDEDYRVKSFGEACSCGACLLCQAKRAVAKAGGDSASSSSSSADEGDDDGDDTPNRRPRRPARRRD